MKSTIEQVAEFHAAFSVDPTYRRPASFHLMLEELMEFYNARTDEERLDALMDLQYFLDGTLLVYGLGHVKDEAFAEVHRSNMSKLGIDGKAIYRADGKVLKGPNYSPPNLAQFIQ